MAANTAPIFGLTPQHTGVTFVNADGTTPKTVYTAGANGGRLVGLAAVTTDTAANVVDIFVTSTPYQVGVGIVPITSGTDNGVTPATNLLTPSNVPCLLPDGSLLVPASGLVKVGPHAAVTAAKTLTITAVGFDF